VDGNLVQSLLLYALLSRVGTIARSKAGLTTVFENCLSVIRRTEHIAF
jgi:hypothetical protein